MLYWACVLALALLRCCTPFKFHRSLQMRSLMVLSVTDMAVADEIDGWNADEFKERFLAEYWQKKPLLVRNAFSKSELLDIPRKRDLLDMSVEEDVESRILIQQEDKSWTKQYGPFERSFLNKLRKTRRGSINDDQQENSWTILVQEVDRHVPKVSDLWSKYFDFIPSWRRDDVMISCATEGGGIGAHVDNYDVFLIQGAGEREWSIENVFLDMRSEKEREVPNIKTRLLRDFVPHQAWHMTAGDMLYLPPRIPHRGVSKSKDCLTVSMGFRAPAYQSMMTALCERICGGDNRVGDESDLGSNIPEKLATLSEDMFYSDKGLKLHSSSGTPKDGLSAGRISSDSVNEIASTLRESFLSFVDDEERFSAWLGEYLSEPLRVRSQSPKAFCIGDMKRDSYDSGDLLPLAVDSKHSVLSATEFTSSEEVLSAFRDKEVVLRRLDGARILFMEHLSCLYVDGKKVTLESIGNNEERMFVGQLVSGPRVINIELAQELSGAGWGVLRDLVERGYLYPVDL